MLVAIPAHAQSDNPSELDRARELNNLGFALHEAGDLVAARQLYAEALQIFEEGLGPAHPNTVTLLENVANVSEEMLDYPTALAVRLRLLEIYESAGESAEPEIALTLTKVGILYRELGELDNARFFLEQAVQVSESAHGFHPYTADSINYLGLVFEDLGQLDTAMSLYSDALSMRENMLGPSDPRTAMSLNNVASLHVEFGEYALAEQLYGRALEVFENSLGDNHPLTATAHNNLGVLFKTRGDFEAAEFHYRKSLAIRKQDAHNPAPEAESLNNLGSLYESMGRVDDAKSFYEQALATYHAAVGPEHPGTAVAYNNIGLLLRSIGDNDQARIQFEKALAIYREYGETHPSLATVVNNLGLIDLDAGEYDSAESQFKQALATFETNFGEQHPLSAQGLHNIGRARELQADLESAQSYYERALSIRERLLGPEHHAVADSLANLGSVQQSLGNLAAARQSLERCFEIRRESLGPEHPKTAEASGNLAGLYWAAGETGQAIDALQRSLEMEEQSLAVVLAIGTEAQRLNHLAMLEGSASAAISLVLEAGREVEEAATLAATTVLRRKGRALEAALRDSWQQGAAQRSETKTLLDARGRLRSQWAHLILNEPANARSQESLQLIGRLMTEIDAIDMELAASGADPGSMTTRVTPADVQENLSANSALIEFFAYRPVNPNAATPSERWGPPSYAAYLLRATGRPLWIRLGRAAAIDDVVTQFRRALTSPGAEITTSARRLDELTMAKIRPLLGDDVDELVISPDGSLNFVPFAAIVDQQNRFLIERYRIRHVNSGRELAQNPFTGGPAGGPLLIGGANFDAAPGGVADERAAPADWTFAGLPGTAEEVQLIGDLLNVPDDRVLVGDSATEAAVREIHSPVVLHVATHGYFLFGDSQRSVDSRQSPQSLRVSMALRLSSLQSGLALSGFNHRQNASSANDGILTALEVAGLNLSGTKLVVLSACETGMGEFRNGEGLFGLRRALVLAGSESQLLTLWQVADDITKEIMVAWYRRMLSGMNSMDALREVQLAAIQSGEAFREANASRPRGVAIPGTPLVTANLNHPYFWASFVLSGVPVTLDDLH